jgi:hypothetical protein
MSRIWYRCIEKNVTDSPCVGRCVCSLIYGNESPVDVHIDESGQADAAESRSAQRAEVIEHGSTRKRLPRSNSSVMTCLFEDDFRLSPTRYIDLVTAMHSDGVSAFGKGDLQNISGNNLLMEMLDENELLSTSAQQKICDEYR